MLPLRCFRSAGLSGWGGLLTGYLNGEPSGSSGTLNGWDVGGANAETHTFAPGRDFSTASPLRLGMGEDDEHEFDGLIDDVAIYQGRALTTAEVTEIYTQGLLGSSAIGTRLP